MVTGYGHGHGRLALLAQRDTAQTEYVLRTSSMLSVAHLNLQIADGTVARDVSGLTGRAKKSGHPHALAGSHYRHHCADDQKVVLLHSTFTF